MDQPSTITEVNDNLEMIADWMGVGENDGDNFDGIYLKNVYRGSKDGFS
jgi:hypothetical protein